MPSLGIVPGAERTTDERLIHGSPGRWVYKRATNECEFPPLGIGVQAIQLSPYRSGVAGPPHTRLLLSPAFQPCACPLALSGPGQAVASESSALNSGLLWRQFAPCVTWRTLSISSSSPVASYEHRSYHDQSCYGVPHLAYLTGSGHATTCATSPCARLSRAPWWGVTPTSTISTP
jgi:hypothetical protein